MCSISTTYHSLCGCYGKPTVAGELCIRALSQPGLSRGCWDKMDLGIETVETACPTCMRASSRSDGSSRIGMASGVRGVLRKDSDVSMGSTSSSTSSTRSARSTASDASRVLSFLPDSVTARRKPLPRSDSAVSVASVQSGKSGRSSTSENEMVGLEARAQRTKNLHWRMFDGRAYGGVEEDLRP